MKQKSRTEYSVMNTTVAFIAQVTAILMGFFTRVVFTRTLSEGYVGINGLFTDILNILSLSELGVGTAITYALYGPIARNDIKKQQLLMRMFRTFYRMTAGFVLVAGLCLIPFLDILMKDRPDVDHLIVIYILYLTNSVVSYLLIYKKTLVDAHQMNYITVMYHNGFLVLQDICQIVVLLLTGNFILFLIVAVVCTISGNICMSRKADRLFPYLKEPCKDKLPQNERRDIFQNVKAMLMHKIGNVVVNNTDNLLISSFVGVVTAGIYSNYFLIIGSVRQVLDQAMLGVTASVGNLGVTEDKEKGIRTVKIGGIGNATGKKYLLRFVHKDTQDGNIRVTIVGNNQAGFTIAFAKDSETVIDAEFKAQPMDKEGTLILYTEDIDKTE